MRVQRLRVVSRDIVAITRSTVTVVAEVVTLRMEGWRCAVQRYRMWSREVTPTIRIILGWPIVDALSAW
jgi:hypothetical protein